MECGMMGETKGQGEGKPHHQGSGAQRKDEGLDGESPQRLGGNGPHREGQQGHFQTQCAAK